MKVSRAGISVSSSYAPRRTEFEFDVETPNGSLRLAIPLCDLITQHGITAEEIEVAVRHKFYVMGDGQQLDDWLKLWRSRAPRTYGEGE